MPAHAPSGKRQKRASVHSTTSSAHPLRQTSFPPDESAMLSGPRSASADSDFTAVTGGKSVVTASGKTKGPRKRRKVTTERSVKSSGREKTVEQDKEGTVDPPDDEDEDDEGGDELADDGEAVDKIAEKKKLEYAHRDEMKLLTSAYPSSQYPYRSFQ